MIVKRIDQDPDTVVLAEVCVSSEFGGDDFLGGGVGTDDSKKQAAFGKNDPDLGEFRGPIALR